MMSVGLGPAVSSEGLAPGPVSPARSGFRREARAGAAVMSPAPRARRRTVPTGLVAGFVVAGPRHGVLDGSEQFAGQVTHARDSCVSGIGGGVLAGAVVAARTGLDDVPQLIGVHVQALADALLLGTSVRADAVEILGVAVVEGVGEVDCLELGAGARGLS